MLISKAMQKIFDGDCKKGLIGIYKYLVCTKLMKKTYKHVMIAFQETLDELINDNDAYELVINVIKDIVTKDPNKWAGIDTINHKELFEYFQKQEGRLKSNNECMIVNTFTWYGNTRGEDDPLSFLLNDNPKSFHARNMTQVRWTDYYTSYFGSDCNGERPGNGQKKRDRFLEGFMYENMNDSHRQRKYVQTMRYNDTFMAMTNLHDGYFNPALELVGTGNIIYNCDVVTILYSMIVSFAAIYKYSDMMRIRKHLLIIKQQSGTSQNDFLIKNKRSLDANVRKKLIDTLQASIHKQIGSIYDDIMVTKKAATKSHEEIKIVQARTKASVARMNAAKAPRKHWPASNRKRLEKVSWCKAKFSPNRNVRRLSSAKERARTLNQRKRHERDHYGSLLGLDFVDYDPQDISTDSSGTSSSGSTRGNKRGRCFLSDSIVPPSKRMKL